MFVKYVATPKAPLGAMLRLRRSNEPGPPTAARFRLMIDLGGGTVWYLFLSGRGGLSWSLETRLLCNIAEAPEGAPVCEFEIRLFEFRLSLEGPRCCNITNNSIKATVGNFSSEVSVSKAISKAGKCTS